MSSLKSKFAAALATVYLGVVLFLYIVNPDKETGRFILNNAMEILALPGMIALFIPLKLLGFGIPDHCCNGQGIFAGVLFTAVIIYFLSLTAEKLFSKAAGL